MNVYVLLCHINLLLKNSGIFWLPVPIIQTMTCPNFEMLWRYDIFIYIQIDFCIFTHSGHNSSLSFSYLPCHTPFSFWFPCSRLSGVSTSWPCSYPNPICLSRPNSKVDFISKSSLPVACHTDGSLLRDVPPTWLLNVASHSPTEPGGGEAGRELSGMERELLSVLMLANTQAVDLETEKWLQSS